MEGRSSCLLSGEDAHTVQVLDLANSLDRRFLAGGVLRILKRSRHQ